MHCVCTWLFYPHKCLCTICLSSQSWEEGINWNVKLQMIVSHQVGAGKEPSLLSYLSSPLPGIFL